MLEAIKNILGIGPKGDFKQMIKEGAVILDVRSKREFSSGHIRNAINIPVEQLNSNLSRLKKKEQHIICYCASGMRSGRARRILKSRGYQSVFNGGSLNSLRNKL